jgi:hypothetical protein
MARRRITSRRPRWFPRLRIHSPLEIRHSFLGQLLCGVGHSAGVLLEGVQQHHEVVGPLVEDAVSRVCESDSQLAQLVLDLRADREVRRWGTLGLIVQVLLDEVINLRRSLRRQTVDELIDGFGAPTIAIENRLRPCHRPSITPRPVVARRLGERAPRTMRDPHRPKRAAQRCTPLGSSSDPRTGRSAECRGTRRA